MRYSSGRLNFRSSRSVTTRPRPIFLRYPQRVPQAFSLPQRPSDLPQTCPCGSETSGSSLTRSSSQPDLTFTTQSSCDRLSRPVGGELWVTVKAGSFSGMSVIRLWCYLCPGTKDQISKLVLLHAKTTARVAVRLAAAEFNLEAHSGDDIAAELCLCLVGG